MAKSGYIEYLAEQIQDPEFAKEFVKSMNDNHELSELINKQTETIKAQDEEIKEIQYGFNMQAEAYINLMEENKRLQDAYNTLEFISKYDGKDNNRRSMREEFTFIKVKAIDCIDRIKKSKSLLNGDK